MSTSSISSVTADYVPWRKGVAWWVVLVQGIILAGLGAWALIQPKNALFVLLIGIGAYLVVMAVWIILQAIRGKEEGFSIFGLLASGGGLTAGLALIMPLLLVDTPQEQTLTVQEQTLFVAFGVALIAIGILALLGAFMERHTGSVAWGTVVRSALYLALGVALIYGVRTQSPWILQWIAWALVIFGVLLVVYSILLMRRQREKQPEAAAPPA